MNSTDDELTAEDTARVLADNEPEQSGEYPTWEYPTRREPKWGEITRQGLVVGRGRNKRVVPPDDVYKLATIGCTDREIAQWFMIAESTLKYNFADYLAKGRAELKQKLRRAQVHAAINGNATMLVWLGKNVLGQTDTPTSNEENQPLPWSD